MNECKCMILLEFCAGFDQFGEFSPPFHPAHFVFWELFVLVLWKAAHLETAFPYKYLHFSHLHISELNNDVIIIPKTHPISS